MIIKEFSKLPMKATPSKTQWLHTDSASNMHNVVGLFRPRHWVVRGGSMDGLQLSYLRTDTEVKKDTHHWHIEEVIIWDYTV